VGELTGRPQDIRQLVASGFAVAEYATGQILPGESVIKIVGPLTPMHKLSAKANLESATVGGPVDWKMVLSTVLSLIQVWLAH